METITFALAAGLLAAFNPCGFALLPSFLALLVAGPGGVLRALRLSTAMTAGFVTVFGSIGAVLAVTTAPIQRHLPWAAVVTGVVLFLLGAGLLSGRELRVRLPRLAAGSPTGSILALYGYGASYAVASLSCTIAPFLAVTGLVSGGGDIRSGVAAFVAYGLGMGLVVGLLAMLVAFAREATVRRTRAVLPWISRLSGAFLLLAGAYVTYYGWYELRLADGGSPSDPLVAAVTDLQGRVTTWLDTIGITWIAAAFAVVAVLAVVTRRKPAPRPTPADGR
ncbi:cytochrome c biogenesis CcdA family protein [Actinoplanes subglobosus]|uniref:Cytochrome c biogenesis CcdA family protein n=1 Tax=Actinoplanes subglobosus TaxID=1547892 RepID=A0ABV8J523_9ACTN